MPDYSFIANAGDDMLRDQGQMNQNMLFAGQMQAGRALQQAIGPDGQVDYNRATSLIGQNRLIAPFAMQALQGALTAQGQSIGNQSAQQKLQTAQGDLVRTAIGSLGPKVKRQDVLNSLNVLSATRQVAPEFAANIAGNLPPDDSQIAAWVQNNFQLPALGAQGALTATSPAPTAIDSGPQINLVRTPEIGAPSAVGHIDKGLSPTESVAPAYDAFNPQTQQMEHVTKGAALKQGAGGAAGAHIPASPPLGAESAANTAGAGAANILNADRADQNSSAQRLTFLRQTLDLLNTPEGKTGPGTQVTNHYRNFLLAQAPYLAAITNGGITEAEIRSATQDQLKKLMARSANEASAQLGQGTDAKLAAAVSANANTDMSTLANRDIVRVNMALERARQAKLAAWDASGQPAASYGAFSSAWNRNHDPRSFMLDLLSPAERAKMLSGVNTDAEKKAFLRGKAAAERAGLFSEKDIPR